MRKQEQGKKRNIHLQAFTLIELLAVIVVLGILMLLIFPAVISQIRKTEGSVSDATEKIIYSATELFLNHNSMTYPKTNGSTYCISLEKLVESKELMSGIVDEKGKQIDLQNNYVRVRVQDNEYKYEYTSSCS